MRIPAAAAAVLLLAAPAAAVRAQAPDDLAQRIVNDPGAPQVNGARGSLRDDPKVQGGKAIRIKVARKGANPWDVFVGNPIKKPVRAGDKLLLAFWARLESGENGATTATLPYNGIQLAASPWTPVFHGPVEIGPEWKLVQVEGKTDKDYPADALGVTIHLASAKQIVDLGPIIVLNQGQ